MKDIQQLIKKNSQQGRYEDIFPKTFIDAVEDRESGNNLNKILAGFNMYFLSYNGSREQTRLQVPMSIRKTGLWITYVLYDKTVVTEWYAGEAINDNSWKSSDNWRVGTNMLVGDISISSDGYWVVNGVVTTTKAQGESGITPMLRVGSNNHLQASYTNGSSWVDVSTNPVYTQFRINNNKLEQSVDLGQTWTVVSDYIASWFRFTGTTGSSQNVGKIQISMDNGVTWSDLSGEFTNSLHIKGYVTTVGALPSSAVQGDIYGVGPTYDPSDTGQTNPIYQLYVKDSTGWVNNGKFTSIAAGVVQTTGTSTTEIMSQNAVTTELDSLRSDLSEKASTLKTQIELSSEELHSFTQKRTNLFNKDSIYNIDGNFINPINGIIYPSSNLCVSHPIFVKQGKTFTFKSPLGLLAVSFRDKIAKYDKNNLSYIGYISATSFDKSTGIVTFTAPDDCYVKCIVNSITPTNTNMFVEGANYPSTYIPFGLYIEDLESIKSDMDLMQNKVNPIELSASKNLFNPANIIIGKRISYNGANTPWTHSLLNSTNSCISGYISIKPNTTYFYHKGSVIGAGSTNSEQSIVFADENYNLLNCIDPDTESVINNVQKSRAIKSPSNAKYCLFCLMWYPASSTPQLIDYGFALFEGSSDNEYVPYRIKISENSLDLTNINQRLESLAYSTEIDITIKSSDKIGFFSNSFLEGYAMLGKHAIEKMMMFTDYIAYNYSKSGDDMIEEASRLDRDEAWLGLCKPSEIGPVKYGIIMHQDNDGLTFNMNHRSYYENAKHLGYQIKSLGGQPILSTEHDKVSNYLIFQRLCQDEGWKFMNWGKVYSEIGVGVYNPFWHSGHPATRTNWAQVHGFMGTILSLPRPEKSIKLFRLRSFIDSTNLNNLLFNTVQERAERYIELHNGQRGIASGQENKFDRCVSYSLTTYPDEYQKLIKNTAVSFGNYMLSDITIPFNVRNVTSAKLKITGTGITHLYAKQTRYMASSWLPTSNSSYVAFGVTSGLSNLTVGQTINVSNITRSDGVGLNTSYVISGIVGNLIITNKTVSSLGAVTSGTDVPICDINDVTLSGSYDSLSPSYIDNYNKPIGQWTNLTFTPITGGIEIDLNSSQIERFGNQDKFTFLSVGNNISITDIVLTVSGHGAKDKFENSINIDGPKIGTSLLTKTTFSDTDTEWLNIASLTKISAITNGTYTEVLPGSVKELNTGDYVAQQMTISNLGNQTMKKPRRVQVQLLARWFPKYILTDEDYSTSELTPDSFDMAKLEVQFNSSPFPSEPLQFPITTMYIGAWWNVYTFELDVTYINNTWLTLLCKDKRVQIAKCDVVVVD